MNDCRMSDHLSMVFKFRISCNNRGKDFWKLNASVLYKANYVINLCKQKINTLKNKTIRGFSTSLWFFLFEIRLLLNRKECFFCITS